jgi:hypothetical protein
VEKEIHSMYHEETEKDVEENMGISLIGKSVASSSA